jgi:hypothetical protein
MDRESIRRGKGAGVHYWSAPAGTGSSRRHGLGHDEPFDIEGIYEVVRAKAEHVDAANARFYKAFARFGSLTIVEAVGGY